MCNNEKLKGKYGFYRTGTEMVGTPPTVVHLAAAGFMDFNGAGQFTAYQNASNGGTYVANNQSQGYYHVYPNCVFHLSVEPYQALNEEAIDLTKVQTVGVLVDGSKELYALSTQAGRAVLFIAKQM